jgi:hypothetical protein
MNYRVLTREEWQSLEPIFKENGSPLPTMGSIAVAENGSGIIAFHCLQPILHVEPIWVHSAYSGKIQFRKLLDELKKEIPIGNEFYAFAPDHLIDRMCAHCRLKKMPYSVWKGAV